MLFHGGVKGSLARKSKEVQSKQTGLQLRNFLSQINQNLSSFLHVIVYGPLAEMLKLCQFLGLLEAAVS